MVFRASYVETESGDPPIFLPLWPELVVIWPLLKLFKNQ